MSYSTFNINVLVGHQEERLIMHNLSAEIHSILSDGTEIDLQSIDFQKNTNFGDSLTEEIKKLREIKKIKIRDVARSKLADVINKFTDLSIEVIGYEDYNACVSPPDITGANPIINKWQKQFYEGDDFAKGSKKNGFMAGGINLKTGKVYGDFKDIQVKSWLGIHLLADKNMTAEGIAAIIMHEVGHVMSAFEFLFRAVRTNFVIQEYGERLLNTMDKDKKILIVDHMSDLEGVKFPNANAIVNAKSKEEVTIMILDNVRTANYEALGKLDFYSERGCEQLADQYVTRLGYGRHLAEALSTMDKEWGIWNRNSLFVTISDVMGFLFLGVVSLGVLPLFIIWNTFFGVIGTDFIYDEPVKRVEVIRKNMLAELKETMRDDHKARLVKEIKIMDELIKSGNDVLGLFERFNKLFGIWGRGAYRSRKHQQFLEDLSTSELRYAVARLESGV